MPLPRGLQESCGTAPSEWAFLAASAQNVQDIAFRLNRASKPRAFAIDQGKRLVRMPDTAESTRARGKTPVVAGLNFQQSLRVAA